MHGAFVCTVQMKGPRWSGKPRGNKRILSLALTHWNNLKDSCSPPGCPKLSDLISLPLCPIHPACCWIMKISKGKRKGPPKWYREDETCLTKPLLLFTLSLTVQTTEILEQQSYPTATEDALLSQVSRLIRANDFSAPADLTCGGRFCA